MTQQDSESIAPAGEVFISYSWDSEAHLRGVLELSNRLRSEGIDCVIDQYEVSPPDGWPRWMDKKIRDSRLILMICTETYCKRVMGEESPDKGMGVRWEGGRIYQHLYNAGANQKFIPVLFRAADKKFIPTPLQSATHYELDSEAGYDRLYARLLNRPGVRKPELGRVRPAPKKEVKTNLSMYVTGPINVDLWNQAKWRGTLFLQYDGQPPILGLGFLDENTHGRFSRNGTSDTANAMRLKSCASRLLKATSRESCQGTRFTSALTLRTPSKGTRMRVWL